jgi:hypothetical protein
MNERKISDSGWLEQKVVNSLAEIVEAARWARKLENLKINSHLPYEERARYDLILEGIISELYAALYDMTKITANLKDIDKWNPGDRDHVYENNREGLADVLSKYGLSGWLGYLGLDDVSPQNRFTSS